MFRPRYILIALIAVTSLVAMASVAAACPSCKAALAGSQEGQQLVRGYFWSICFMMSMPFTLLGGMGCYMYLLVRKARREGGPNSTLARRRPSAGAAAIPEPREEPVGV